MPRLLIKFFANKAGATAFEYTLLAGLIGLVIFSNVGSIGNKISNGLLNAANKLK